MSPRWFLLVAVVGPAAIMISCSDGGTGSTAAPLVAACVDDVEELSPEDWLCPDDFTVECEEGEGDPDTIYLTPAGDLSESTCDEIDLTLNQDGPFGVGEHDVMVTAAASSDGEESAVFECEAKLTVVDTQPPAAEPKTPKELWPPNHKFRTVTAEDCADIRDACDEDVEVRFLEASSDEPVNATGDGNTEPDIVFDCDGVKLRSERQGPSNGRVYTLVWVASDEAGNETEGECKVVVPHDQSGREAIDDGPAYTMMAPDLDCEDDDDDSDEGQECECESCVCDDCECDDAMTCGCEACECMACSCDD